MRRLSLGLLGVFLLASASVNAAPTYSVPSQSLKDQSSDLISFGGAYFDFDKSEPKTSSADFRLEYRFAYAPWGGETWGIHPFLGYETTSRNMEFGLGGLALNWNFAHHGVATWSEGMGYLDSGDQRSLGGTFQFRSQIEAGYRFDNDMRITAEFSHISDAKLTRWNPGAEILGLYWHVPTSVMFGAAK